MTPGARKGEGSMSLSKSMVWKRGKKRCPRGCRKARGFFVFLRYVGVLALTFAMAASALAQNPSSGFGEGMAEEEKQAGFETLEMIVSCLNPSNGMVRVIKAASKNPVVGEVWRDHGDTLLNEILGASLGAFVPLVILMGGGQALGFFVAAWVTSKLFAPQKATFRNAAFFALVSVLLFFVGGIALVMFHAGAFLVIAGPIIGLVTLFTLAAATIYIYGVDFFTMIWIALVGFFVQGAVTCVFSSIAILVSFQQMVGPIANTMAYAFAENATPYVTARVEELHPKHDALQEKVEEAKVKFAEFQAQLKESQERLKKSQAKVESKRQEPLLVYTAIGQLVDKGEWNQAIAAYAEFGAKFNGHPLVKNAIEQIRALEEQKIKSTVNREAARQAEMEAKRQRMAIFKQRLKGGKATLSNIRKALLGKDRSDVVALLGRPDATGTNVFIYTNTKVFDPVRDKSRQFIVNFLEGRVQGVNYIK